MPTSENDVEDHVLERFRLIIFGPMPDQAPAARHNHIQFAHGLQVQSGLFHRQLARVQFDDLAPSTTALMSWSWPPDSTDCTRTGYSLWFALFSVPFSQ